MTCFFRNVKGAVTPALCIVVSAVVLLNFALIDCLKIFSIPNLLKERQELGVQSAMSFFYKTLQEDYGLYGIHCSDFGYAEEAFTDSLSEDDGGLSLAVGKSPLYAELSLMDYAVGETELFWEKSLGDVDVLKKQIYEIMKYKAAGNAVAALGKQVKALTGLSSMAGIYGKYTSVSEMYDAYKAELSELYRCVDGDTELSPDCVNGIDRLPICKDGAFVRNLTQIILPEGTAYTETQAEQLKNSLKIYALPAEILAQANLKAVQACDGLTAIIDGQRDDIDEIKKWLGEYEAKEEYEKLFMTSMENMIGEIKNTYIEVYLPGIKNTALENREKLVEAGSLLTALEGKIVANCTLKHSEINAVTESLSDAYGDYEAVTLPPRNTEDGAEGRYENYLLSSDSDLTERFTEENTGEIPNEVYSSLPSVLNCSGYKYYLHGIEKVKFTPNSASDIVYIMENCEEIGSLISRYASDVSQSIMTDLYVLEYFNCDTDDCDVDESNDRFLEYEVEYIISGARKEFDNVTDVYARMIELRAGFNTVHILCDKEKMDTARAAGKALSALSAEIGSSVYTALVIAGWAFSEAMYDVRMLENGKTVPLIKKKGDWVTSVDGLTFGSAYNPGKDSIGKNIENEVTDSENILSMDYKEYLTLLLLQVPNDVKLYRIQDVLELNLYKASNERIKVSDFYTKVKCECVYVFDTFLYAENRRRQYTFSEVTAGEI